MTMGYKTKISRIDGLPYFLNNGAPRAREPITFMLCLPRVKHKPLFVSLVLASPVKAV